MKVQAARKKFNNILATFLAQGGKVSEVAPYVYHFDGQADIIDAVIYFAVYYGARAERLQNGNVKITDPAAILLDTAVRLSARVA